MNREVHVRFWEGVGVKFSRATQLKSVRNQVSVPDSRQDVKPMTSLFTRL